MKKYNGSKFISRGVKKNLKAIFDAKWNKKIDDFRAKPIQLKLQPVERNLKK